MDRLRTRPHALQGIELAVEAQRTLVAPDQSHNLYRFFDGADGLAGAPSRATHAGHGVPKSPGAKPDLHPPCREHVEAGGCLREHGRRTEREVDDVGEEADVFGHRHERRDERPGIQKAPLVGMVLNSHQVETGSVSGLRYARRQVRRVRERCHAHAELESPAVIAHVVCFAVVLLSPSAATSEMRRARVRARKASEYAGASSGFSAPASASLRDARNAPITAGPVPPPRKNAPLKIPSPAPTSSGPRAEAAALIFGELARANPAPTPSIPSETTTGVVPAPNGEIESTESSIVTSPVNMSGRTPILSDHRPASGEIMASATAPGVSTSPACPGESPLTSETSNGTKTSADTLASMLKYPTTTAAT